MQALLDYGCGDSDENEASEDSGETLAETRTDADSSLYKNHHLSSAFESSNSNNNTSHTTRDVSNLTAETDKQTTEFKNMTNQADEKEPQSNFFGLDSSDSDNSSNIVSSCKHRKTENRPSPNRGNRVYVGGVEILLPDSEFWADTANDIETTETILPATCKGLAVNMYETNSATSFGNSPYTRSINHRAQHKKQKLKSHAQPQNLYSQKLVKSCQPTVTAENEGKHRPMYYIHSKISPYLQSASKLGQESRPSKSKQISLPGHKGVVNRVKWCCSNYSHLLLSASMDNFIKVWNCWSQLDPCLRTFTHHRKAVKDAEWSPDGKKILSCSYDRTAVVTDVETGQLEFRFTLPGYATCGKFQPIDPNLIVIGSNNCLQCWDLRQSSDPVKTFTHKDKFGQVQDVIISPDGSQVFGSCDLISRDSSDRNIIAWDFKSSVILSNQIFQERYVCSRLKLHPTEGTFLAQTHGNYIAEFSIHRPYKLNKYRRFEGHKMQGFNIGFDISPDGGLVCSGSGDGRVHFYHYKSGKTIQTFHTGSDICMDVAYHPVLFSTVACASWSGDVAVWM